MAAEFKTTANNSPHPRRSATPPLPNWERGPGGEGFNPTALGDLPAEWEVVRLDNVIESGKSSINPLDFPTEKFDYYSIPAYQVSVNPFIEIGNEIRSQKLLVETGTVLFGKLNPNVPKVWRVVSNSERRKIASTEFIPLVPKKGKIDFQFLYFLALSNYVLPKSQELVSGSTPSRQRVDHKSFTQIPIPLPPLDEQRRIAYVLNTVQQAIAAQDDLIAAAQEVKRSLMRRLFTYGPGPEPVPTKETKIGEVPEHWEVVEWGSISEIIMGQSPPGHTYNEYGNGIPLINGPAEYGPKHPMPTKWTTQPTKISRPNDILFCVRGNTTGRMNIADREYCIGRGVAAIRELENVSDIGYLFYLASKNANRILSIATAGGSTFPNISKSQLNGYKVPSPPIDEQHQIAHILQTADAKIAAEQDRRAALQALFNSLLQELMTGKLRV